MTHIKILSCTSEGAERSAQITDDLQDALIEQYQLSEDISLAASSLKRLVQQAMVDCDLVVFISEIETAVRTIAPYITNTGYDPGVMCLNPSLSGVVQLLNSQKNSVNVVMNRIADLFQIPLIK